MKALTATRLWWAQSVLLRAVLALPLMLLTGYVTAWLVYWYDLGVVVFVGTAILIAAVYRIPIYYLGLAVTLRPLVDTLWFVRVDMAGQALNLQRLWGLVMPLFFIGVLLFHALFGREDRGRRLPGGVLWAILFLWLLAPIEATRDLKEVKNGLLAFFRSYANLVFVFVGFVFCRRRDFMDQFLKAFLLMALAPIAVAVAQGIGLLPGQIIESVETNTSASFLKQVDMDAMRLAGLYYDPGSLVVVLLTGLTCALYLLSSDQEKGWKLLSLVAIAMMVFAMKNSYLRQGWVAVPVLFATWMFMRRRFSTLVLFAGLTALLVLLNLRFMALVFAGVWEVFFETNRIRLGYLWSGRIGAWMDVWDWFRDATWTDRILGGGYNLQIDGFFRKVANPHNQWLMVLMDNGLLGLSAYLMMLLSMFVLLLRNFRLSNSSDRWIVGVQAAMAQFVLFLFMSVGSQPLNQFNQCVPFFMLIGYIAYREVDVLRERREALAGKRADELAALGEEPPRRVALPDGRESRGGGGGGGGGSLLPEPAGARALSR
jgi:O-antigen ligase